ncbi:MAG: MamK family actin-like protein [Planctomycetota bacterium]
MANTKTILESQADDSGREVQAMVMGIDLGTSRSSIAAMNGVRKTVESYVGYAKDAVSRKHLGADILYGRDALDNAMSVNLYRPLEKGVIKGTLGDDTDELDKNLEAAKLLVHRLVELTKPSRDDALYGVIGVPSQASDKNKEGILESAKDIFDAVMIVSEPFTVAYGMERLSDVLVVDIGAGTTDLSRMHGTVPAAEDERSFPIAGDAIDRELHKLLTEKHPEASITVNMCKKFKENYGYVSDTKDPIIVQLPVKGKPTDFDITEDMKAACEILVEPILEGVADLIATFNPEFQEKLRNNIIIAGGGSQMRGLNSRVEKGLERVGGGKVTVVDEPIYAGANGALQLALDMPADYWQQLSD